MLIHDHASQPYGGHSYPDPSGVTLTDKTIPGLLAKIRLYRANNGLAAGSPEADLEAHYRVVHPHLVSVVGATPTATEDPVARWLNRIWRTPPKEKEFVETLPYNDRLATCAECPHYEAIHPYSTDDKRRLIILAAGRISDHGICKIHHWPVGLAALIAQHDTEDVDGCWANRESCSGTTAI